MLLYHFIDAKYGLINIRDRHLHVSRIKNLNDPYELYGLVEANENQKEKIQKDRNEIDNKYGIISFSNSFHNPLLWGHYADKHKGICLGFDVASEYHTEVEYFKEPQKVSESVLTEKMTQSKVDKFLNKKYAYWEYEKEFRIIRNLDKCIHTDNKFFTKFSTKIDLKEIIVGINSKVTRSCLEDLLGEKGEGVKIFKSELLRNKFFVKANEWK